MYERIYCVTKVGYKTPVRVPRSGNPWIDGLTDGYRWGVTDSDRKIGYTFIGDTSEMQMVNLEVIPLGVGLPRKGGLWKTR